jgi:hypothetical protein
MRKKVTNLLKVPFVCFEAISVQLSDFLPELLVFK